MVINNKDSCMILKPFRNQCLKDFKEFKDMRGTHSYYMYSQYTMSHHNHLWEQTKDLRRIYETEPWYFYLWFYLDDRCHALQYSKIVNHESLFQKFIKYFFQRIYLWLRVNQVRKILSKLTVFIISVYCI